MAQAMFSLTYCYAVWRHVTVHVSAESQKKKLRMKRCTEKYFRCATLPFGILCFLVYFVFAVDGFAISLQNTALISS